MFLILVYFCYVFYKHAREKGHTEASRRAFVYALCGLVIIASIAAMVFDTLAGEVLSKNSRFIFYCEQAGLAAFGFSWLTASRIFPFFTRRDERFSPWG